MEPKHLGAFWRQNTDCLGARPGLCGSDPPKPAPRGSEPPPQTQASARKAAPSPICGSHRQPRPPAGSCTPGPATKAAPGRCGLPCEPTGNLHTGRAGCRPDYAAAGMGHGNAQDMEMPGTWECVRHGNEWQRGNTWDMEMHGTWEHMGMNAREHGALAAGKTTAGRPSPRGWGTRGEESVRSHWCPEPALSSLRPCRALTACSTSSLLTPSPASER